MPPMLCLRKEGDALPSMHHFGQDALRQIPAQERVRHEGAGRNCPLQQLEGR